jgi:hypothetical protein
MTLAFGSRGGRGSDRPRNSSSGKLLMKWLGSFVCSHCSPCRLKGAVRRFLGLVAYLS